jgi:phage terminase small subunit
MPPTNSMARKPADIAMLNDKQRRFVEEYLIDLNATQAAIRAGYSERTAHSQGPRLLENVGIIAAIEEAKAERSKRTKIDADWLLKRLADEATADIADLYDDDNNLKSVKDWPLIWRQGLVAGVEIDALYEGYGEDREQVGHTKKLKLSDRIKRLELIGRHVDVQAFKEKVEVELTGSLAERLARAKARAGK